MDKLNICLLNMIIRMIFYLSNEFNFWNHYGIMSTSGLLQCKWSPNTLSLQETRSIHDSMNRPKIEFIAYIYILL